MECFNRLRYFLEDRGLDGSPFHLDLLASGQFEVAVVIVIFDSFAAMTQDLQQFLPGAVETFQHVIGDFPDASDDEQCVLFGQIDDLFPSLFEQPAHFGANRVVLVDKYLVVHVGGSCLQTVDVLVVLGLVVGLLVGVGLPSDQGGWDRILINNHQHVLDFSI